LGDAYAELESYDKAMASYQAAIAHADNEFSTPIYLKKAALLAYQINDFSKAKAFAEDLKERFPDSPESVNIDGLIGLASK
jgi:tetratricopeptide (TPR) repeat protein